MQYRRAAGVTTWTASSTWGASEGPDRHITRPSHPAPIHPSRRQCTACTAAHSPDLRLGAGASSPYSCMYRQYRHRSTPSMFWNSRMTCTGRGGMGSDEGSTLEGVIMCQMLATAGH